MLGLQQVNSSFMKQLQNILHHGILTFTEAAQRAMLEAEGGVRFQALLTIALSLSLSSFGGAGGSAVC